MTQRVAFVTGAMGGLGTAICQAFAKDGHKVVAAYHPQFDNKDEWLKEMEAAGFKDFICVAGDVADEVAGVNGGDGNDRTVFSSHDKSYPALDDERLTLIGLLKLDTHVSKGLPNETLPDLASLDIAALGSGKGGIADGEPHGYGGFINGYLGQRLHRA